MESIHTHSNNRRPMEQVLYEVKKIIVGQDHLLERLVVALLARGHILVEGVPGAHVGNSGVIGHRVGDHLVLQWDRYVDIAGHGLLLAGWSCLL